MKPVYIVGAAAAAVGLAFLFGGDDEETPEVGESPKVGFSPATSTEILIPTIPEPTKLEQWEDEVPTMGTFFQVRRGYIFLGTGRKSISWTALYRAANWCMLSRGASKEDAEKYAEHVAHNGNYRQDYVSLILSGYWNDTYYGTWGYSRRSFPGPHGRSIPLEAVHADNRSLLLNGQAPARQVPRGNPEDKGTGSCVATTGLCRPYLWMPMINLDAFLGGEVTTRDVIWPGERRISQLEPPPEFWALGGMS